MTVGRFHDVYGVHFPRLLISPLVRSYSGGISQGWLLEEGANFLGALLKATHGGDNLAFEVDFIRHDHTAHGVSLQMLPHELVGVAVGRVWRQEKQLQPAAERFDKSFGLSRAMRWAAIDDQEDRACLTDQQPFEEFDKDIGIHPTFFFNHEAHAAFEVIADIRLMA